MLLPYIACDADVNSSDFRQNSFHEFPVFIYDLPKEDMSTIDLRSNLLDLSSETSAHKKQLKKWLDDEVLQVDRDTLDSLNSLTRAAKSSVLGTTKAVEHVDKRSNPASSRGSDTVSTMKESGSSLDAIPIAIAAFSITTMLVVGVTLAFVARKRRRMQVRSTEGILDLPHFFDKSLPVRSESSSHVTTVESELSRSRMSSGEGRQEVEDRDTCFIVPMSPTGSELSYKTTVDVINAGYVDLKSPQDADQDIRIDIPRHDDGESNQSLELLSTYSTASITAIDHRTAARNALRSALTTLLATKSNEGAPLLTVNTFQYSLDPETSLEETELAFLIDCRRVHRSLEKATFVPAPHQQLVLKFFVEEDAEFAGRESYALKRLHTHESACNFAPQLIDDALDYELQVGHFHDAVRLSCCILVLDRLGGTRLEPHMASSRMPPEQRVLRVVNAVRALHSQRLVHGALHTDSLVASPLDDRIHFWGLEHASRVGHTVACFDTNWLKIGQAECTAPEIATQILEDTLDSRASMSLDIWSLGVVILRIYASGRQLEEFQDCTTPYTVLERLCNFHRTERATTTCFFERSIAQLVPTNEAKDLLRQCLQHVAASRPSIDSIAKHKLFQPQEREISRTTTVTNAATLRMLSAVFEERRLSSLRPPLQTIAAIEPELVALTNPIRPCDDVTPEPMPPSLWLFLPPIELQVDLTQQASCYSVDEWVVKLKRLQQQRAEEIRFPLVFMCETCESGAAIPCSIATATKYGASVSSSLLSLVMPLVRETMLFLEARAILSNGLSVGEASGLAGPRQWDELRTFYRALERMELATVNPVNELEFAPLEQQLKSQDQVMAQQVLDKLTLLNFSEDKREYVRSLLDALVSEKDVVSSLERSSWAALRRCDVSGKRSSTLGHTRWLCSHHAPLEN